MFCSEHHYAFSRRAHARSTSIQTRVKIISWIRRWEKDILVPWPVFTSLIIWVWRRQMILSLHLIVCFFICDISSVVNNNNTMCKGVKLNSEVNPCLAVSVFLWTMLRIFMIQLKLSYSCVLSHILPYFRLTCCVPTIQITHSLVNQDRFCLDGKNYTQYTTVHAL